MNQTCGSRASEAKSVYMSHYIMSATFLFCRNYWKFLVLDDDIFPHLRKGFISYTCYTKLFLCFCENQPKLTPCGNSLSWGEELFHLLAAIARIQGGLIFIIVGAHLERLHSGLQNRTGFHRSLKRGPFRLKIIIEIAKKGVC